MDYKRIESLAREADEDLDRARQELYKPSSDVVCYAACVFARRALHRWMECLYLLVKWANNEVPEEGRTIEEMVDYCRMTDIRLNEYDFDFMNCRGQLELGDLQMYYCDEPEKVGECLNMAENIRYLVQNAPWSDRTSGSRD